MMYWNREVVSHPLQVLNNGRLEGEIWVNNIVFEVCPYLKRVYELDGHVDVSAFELEVPEGWALHLMKSLLCLLHGHYYGEKLKVLGYLYHFMGIRMEDICTENLFNDILKEGPDDVVKAFVRMDKHGNLLDPLADLKVMMDNVFSLPLGEDDTPKVTECLKFIAYYLRKGSFKGSAVRRLSRDLQLFSDHVRHFLVDMREYKFLLLLDVMTSVVKETLIPPSVYSNRQITNLHICLCGEEVIVHDTDLFIFPRVIQDILSANGLLQVGEDSWGIEPMRYFLHQYSQTPCQKGPLLNLKAYLYLIELGCENDLGNLTMFQTLCGQRKFPFNPPVKLSGKMRRASDVIISVVAEGDPLGVSSSMMVLGEGYSMEATDLERAFKVLEEAEDPVMAIPHYLLLTRGIYELI